MGRIRDAAMTDPNAYNMLAHLTDTIGPRLSGSLQAQAAVEWLAAKMREVGASVTLEKTTVPHWVRGKEDAVLTRWPRMPAGTTQKIVVTALGNSAPTSDHHRCILIQLLHIHRNLGRRVKVSCQESPQGCRQAHSMIRGTSILTANSNRLSHFGRRMSLFLPGLVLLGILFGEQEHRLQEFHMEKILTQYVVCALAAALMVPLAQAQSQPAGLQAAFAKDAGTLSDKFTGLAALCRASMTGSPARAFAPSATCST